MKHLQSFKANEEQPVSDIKSIKPGVKGENATNNANRKCYRCHSQHEYGSCPAYNQKCNKCHAKGRYDIACKDKVT